MDRDHEAEQELHRRRLMLMRMQGDLYRSEMRMYLLWAAAATLGAVALILSCL